MKKIVSILLASLLLLSVLPLGIFAAEPETVEVGTADALVSVITDINSRIKADNTNITLTADIDLSGNTDFLPLATYSGVFDGGNHTISGLSKTIVVADNNEQSVDAGKGNVIYRWSGEGAFPSGTAETKDANNGGFNCWGYCGMATLFVMLTGTVKDLTVKDGSISLDAQFNKNILMDLAYVAGYALNATFENVHAINIDVSTPSTGNENTTNENQGHMGGAAVIAGRASGNTTFTNCTVDSTSSVDTSKCPRMNGAGILGAYDDNGATNGSINTANAGDLTFNFCSSDATVTVCTDNSIDLMFKNGVRCDGVPGDLFKANDGGNLIYGTKLEDTTSYTFYYQTRINKDDPTAKDYRIICIADASFIEGAAAVNATITFTDGVTPKSFTPTATTVFKSVSASGEGYTDVYYANEGDIVFGWVVTGVPAAYQTNPTATATVVPVEAN